MFRNEDRVMSPQMPIFRAFTVNPWLMRPNPWPRRAEELTCNGLPRRYGVITENIFVAGLQSGARGEIAAHFSGLASVEAGAFNRISEDQSTCEKHCK